MQAGNRSRAVNGFDHHGAEARSAIAELEDFPSQSFRNHVEEVASIDLFVVPTIAFQPLFALLVLGHLRRQLLWFAVTQNPTAEWAGAPNHRSITSLGGAIAKHEIR